MAIRKEAGYVPPPPPPPPGKPRKKHPGCLPIALLGLGILSLALISFAIGANAGAKSKASPKPPATPTARQALAPATVAPTVAPTSVPTKAPAAPAPAPKPVQAPPPAALLDVTAQGSKHTPPFAAPAHWRINFSFQCPPAYGQGNFQIYVYDGATLQDVPVNQLAQNGEGSSDVYRSGQLHLEIISECNWHIQVVKA